MHVMTLSPTTRNAEGCVLSGYCEFSDGKEWKFFRSSGDRKLRFIVDTGVPSQHAVINHTRIIEPPKRVAALKMALAEINQIDFA